MKLKSFACVVALMWAGPAMAQEAEDPAAVDPAAVAEPAAEAPAPADPALDPAEPAAEAPAAEDPAAEAAADPAAQLASIAGLSDAEALEIYLNTPERLPATMSDEDWARLRALKAAAQP